MKMNPFAENRGGEQKRIRRLMLAISVGVIVFLAMRSCSSTSSSPDAEMDNSCTALTAQNGADSSPNIHAVCK